jgi:hypothetical protein
MEDLLSAPLKEILRKFDKIDFELVDAPSSNEMDIYMGALLTLFAEAKRRNWSINELDQYTRTIIERDDIVQSIVDKYATNGPKIDYYLSTSCARDPHLVDVHWRLLYEVCNSVQGRTRRVKCLVELLFLRPADNEDSSSKEKLHFMCSVEELQDLVVQLKDARNNIARHSSSK